MEYPICAECGGPATMLIDDDWLCEECTSGMHEYDDTPPDTEPDGTCIDCGRLLVDPTGLLCAACQPETVPLAQEGA
jgi:hypothetical protein